MRKSHKSSTHFLLTASLLYYLFTSNNQVFADTYWAPSSNDIYNTNNANVGIGTTTPATKLDVVGSYKVLRLTNSSSYVGMQLNGATNYDSNLYFAEGGSDKYILGWHADGDYLRFYDYVDGSTDMVISASGNVGIGTASPGSQLDIIGSHRVLKLSDPTSYAGLQINSGSGYDANVYFDEAGVDKYIIGWDASASSLRFFDGTNTDMVINASGNIGVGTDTPDVKLDIEGSNNLLRLTDSSSWVGLQLNAANAQRSSLYFQEAGTSKYEISWEGGSDYLKFYGDGVTDMVIDSDGDVGIGTTSPSKRLDVAGEASFDGALFAKDATGIGLKDDGGNLGLWVEDGGNVGVGVADPGAVLHLKDVSSGSRVLQFGTEVYLTEVDQDGILGIYADDDNTRGAIRLGSGGATIEGGSNGDICIGDCD